jgi:hypothetical protein
MKVFKILHLNILDFAIVRDTSTFHGVNKGPPSTRQMVSNGLLNKKMTLKIKMKTLIAWR